MEIIIAPPPFLDRIRQAGMGVDLSNTVFTYGNKLYNPGGREIPNHLMEHEETHERQQLAFKGGPDAWWDRYLVDVQFRLDQEVEAYRAQYRFYCDRHPNRKKREWMLNTLADALCGPLYGGLVDFKRAYELMTGTVILTGTVYTSPHGFKRIPNDPAIKNV